VAEAEMRLYELARRNGVKLQGAVTWAFEFEDQPAFAGYRELATNGIDKPVFNVLSMMALLGGNTSGEGKRRIKSLEAQWLAVTSDGAQPLDSILANGVTGSPDINAVATRNGDEIDILLWNYHDADIEAPPATISLEIDGLKGELLESEYLVDRTHSNSYAWWLKMGSPEKLDRSQTLRLRQAGSLQQVTAEKRVDWVKGEKGATALTLTLERQAVALIRLYPRPTHQSR
jgi:xylan 1,4-beta-xylosidase